MVEAGKGEAGLPPLGILGFGACALGALGLVGCPPLDDEGWAVSGTAVAKAASNSAIACKFASGNGTGVGMASPIASNPFSSAV